MSLAKYERRNALAVEMQTLAAKDELNETEEARFVECDAEIRKLDADLDRYESTVELEARKAPEAATVPEVGKAAPSIREFVIGGTSKPEPRISAREVSPYAEKSGESWFADVRTVKDRFSSDAEVNEARGRLAQHYASANDEGGARQIRTLSSTTDAEGGYLVAPAHLQDMFARYLVSGATTVGLVSKMPLPAKTSLIKIPKMDGATVVAQHTQNAALTETSATFTTVNATVYRYGGAQTIPNFLLDRSLPGVDQIVLGDLARQLALKVNTDIVGGTTPEGILNADGVGTATATAGTATWSDVYPALANAVMDCAGSHYAGIGDLSIVMAPRRWSWCISQLDADKRPLVSSFNPQNAGGTYTGIAGPEGLSAPVSVGSILGVPVYLDSTIPLTNGAGTDEDRIIVGAFKEAMLFQAVPVFGMSTEAEFLKDQTIVRVTQDVAFTAERYPGAFSIISGTALND